MNNDIIAGSRKVKFLKPGEKYHWVRETAWEREWEAEGLLPKRWAVAGEPVVVDTYDGGKEWVFIKTTPRFAWDYRTDWIREVDEK